MPGERAPRLPGAGALCAVAFPKTSVPPRRRVPFDNRVEFTVRLPFRGKRGADCEVFVAVRLGRVSWDPRTRVPLSGMVWLVGVLALVELAVEFNVGRKVSTRVTVWLSGLVRLKGFADGATERVVFVTLTPVRLTAAEAMMG